MSQHAQSVRVSARAAELADEMLNNHEVMMSILNETIPSENEDDPVVRESGRTYCGNDSTIRGPLARFPTAVELAECPLGTNGGTWHTHVTKKQLREPTNSLPDMANVFFGGIDVSIVAGTVEAEAVMAADDEQQAISEFQDALGAEVESTEDVVDAILSGKIPSPTDARRRVRSRMSDLFSRQKTRYNGLDTQVRRASIPASSVVKFEMVEAQRYHNIAQSTEARAHRKNPVRNPSGARNHIRGTNRRVKSMVSSSSIPEKVGDSALKTMISRAISALL